MRKILFSVGLLMSSIAAIGQGAWTLEQCVAEAEKNNISIRDLALEIEISKLDETRAKGSFLPTLNGFATHGYNWGRVIDPFTNTFASDRVRTNNLGVQANADLFAGFRNQRTLEQSRANIEVSELSMEAAKVTLQTSVVDNFLSLLDIQERLKMARIQAGRTTDQRGDLEKQVTAGNRAKADLFDLDAQIAQEEFNVTDLEVQLDRAKLTMIQLMQLQGISIIDFNVKAPDISATDVMANVATFSEVLNNAKEKFPAYRQAVLNERSAALGVQIAEAGRMPTLSVSGSLGSGYSGRNSEIIGEPIFGQPTPIGLTASGETVFAENVSFNTQTKGFSDQLSDNFNQSLSLSLSVPIFNGFRNKVAIDQAKIRQLQAGNQVRNTLDQLSVDIQNALARQASSAKQYLSAVKNHEAAEEAYRYAVARSEQGAITSLELRTSKANLDSALAQMINSKYAAVLANKYLDILQGIPLTL